MLEPAKIFSRGMILQREKPVHVWGKADPESVIHVRIQGKETVTKADGSGIWKAVIEPLSTSFSETMEIISDAEKAVIDNVAVGEVWLAGGQSNMEYQMYYDAEKKKEMEREPDLYIRQFTVPKISWEGEEQKYDFSRFGFWRCCSGEDLEYFSAVAYYYARKLRESTDVPIGILDCSYGGTRACCWMTEKAILESGGAPWLTEYADALTGIDIQKESQAFRSDPSNAYTDPFHDKENSRLLYPGLSREQQEKIMWEEPPQRIIGNSHPCRPAGLFYTMLRTVIPYSLRGVLFYQGESDALHAELYGRMLTGLIRLWREEWKEEFPFLLVQLAPFEWWMTESGIRYPELRCAQERVSQNVSGVWIASNGDAGMRWDIHPKQKRKIGERLALLAEKHVYEEDVLCDAPCICDAYLTDGGIVLSFTNTASLSLEGERVNALQLIASGCLLPEKSYRTELSGNTVRISLSQAGRVTEIRFAQTPYYEINLYNEAGIPVLPFKITDIRKREEEKEK